MAGPPFVEKSRKINTIPPLVGGGDLSADRTLSFAGLFDVHAYGAAGDGSTDDQPAIQAAIDAVKAAGGGILWFQPGHTYRHNRELIFDGMQRFVVLGNHATLLNGDTPPLPPPGQPPGLTQAGIRLVSCGDFSILDLIVDGNRLVRLGPNPPTGASGPNNVRLQQCTRFSLRGVRSNNATGDGFYVSASIQTDASTYSRNGHFLGCSAEGCFRNGMSIINAVDLQVIGGSFSHQGGTNPQAGIDLEPNDGSLDPGVERISIQGVSFADNTGRGVQVSERVRQVTITGCHFKNCYRGGVLLGGSEATVEGCTFQDFDAAQLAVIAVRAGADQATVHGNLLRRISGEAAGGIVVAGATSRVVVTNNNLFDFSHASSTALFAISCNSPLAVISGNRLENIGYIGIGGRGANLLITNNLLIRTTTTAISFEGANVRVLGNMVIDSAIPSGGDIRAHPTAARATIDYNTVLLTVPDAARSAIYCQTDPASVTGNQILGYSSTEAIKFLSGHTDAANDLPTARFANSGSLNALEIHRFRLGDRVHHAGVAPPASGTWAQGDIVFNTAPTPGGFVGWVCTSSGTPGTWNAFGAISA